MKARYLLIVLCLVSHITVTLSSVVLAVIAAVASIGLYIYNTEPDGLLPFDSKRLEKDLNESLFGQHIAFDVVLKSLSSFMTDSKPNKPLVLSFHGNTGVGKNYVTKIIARNVYEKGDNSKHFHLFVPGNYFPYKEYSPAYSAHLKKLIVKEVYWFPRSMFIFDELDKMNPQLINTIKPFLYYNARVDGVSFRNAIFIFLSNAGGNEIAEVAQDFRREGKDREEIKMNSKELETKISQSIMSGKSMGFLLNRWIRTIHSNRSSSG
ncbi:torsin-1A-like isoform X2 [Megalobrama amblycephala]|uniref:torsin-1A-like isoform X2 n=1 Tax=Megalobrama amblycephala TaxID=75352 RepID=UPI002014571D|nr:torsin-1A-like isoform X2 [Megalobrama amblycephala]